MKSSRSNQTLTDESGVPEAATKVSAVEVTPEKQARGFRGVVRRFKKDLREPLPGSDHLGRWGKIKARFVHLAKRYGWKLLVAVILYYLIRDTILYIVIPYLIARHFID